MKTRDQENAEVVNSLVKMIYDNDNETVLYIAYIKEIAKKLLNYSRIGNKRVDEIARLLSVQNGIKRVPLGIDGSYSEHDYFALNEYSDQDDEVACNDSDDEAEPCHTEESTTKPQPVNTALIKPDKPVSTKLSSQAQMGRLLSAHLREKTSENGVNAVYLFLCCPHCDGEIRVEASATPVVEPDDSLPF